MSIVINASVVNLAETIKVRRAAKSYSQADLAKKAGVSQQLINALEHGTVGTTKFIPELAAALGCKVEELEPRFGSSMWPKAFSSGNKGSANELPIYSAQELPAFPRCAGLSSEPVDFMNRPSHLKNVRDCYAVFVAEDLMFPEFERGDIAIINPLPPPIAGTTCNFSRDNDGMRISKIRRLESFTPQEWRIMAWNGRPGQVTNTSLNREQ